jgi:hypothetical protein
MSESDAVLIEEPDAARVLDAIRTLAPRVAAEPDSLLIFYYSGHADDRALLFGDTELALTELRAALEAVPAKLSLQIVDACKSGAMTRAKGAKIGAPFSVFATGLGEGRVVITSSAEWEDAQESDRLGGSFFTFHLAGGLRGAADIDNDGTVTLAEAYAYVYGRTVESTLATASGPQHPTFRYDMQGRGELILTKNISADAGIIKFSGNGDYLVVDSVTGRVVAELRTKPSGDKIALRAGDYRISRRTNEGVFEGAAKLEPKSWIDADATLAKRTEHAYLVRKGGGAVSVAHALQVSFGARGPLGRGISAAPLIRAAYVLSTSWLTLRPRLGLTLPTQVLTPRLSMSVGEATFGLEALHTFDYDFASVSAGVLADGLLMSQRRGSREPDEYALGFAAGLTVSVETRPWHNLFAIFSGEVAAHTFPVSDADRAPAGDGHLYTALTYAALIGVGLEL